MSITALPFAESGKTLVVEKINGDDVLKEYLENRGLSVGTEFYILSHDDINWQLKFGQSALGVGKQIALRIIVSEKE